ncbi:hypothetical protein OG585_50625 (plasmid) [Streptomyces sp. NBC_01340]|nr:MULTISPECIES: hypothetical protein [unclassified Streptomyces]MCX4460617.1 hypothetical protein [Streptomyces sp. NBC_01719]MCX4500053.1 hypothetical protein [Streptomyces sp. NBC_01728]MCX4597797.1 hypothetical protein [Streptomyces sp. NBC_01549]WSI45154.1 hypothetical protein OG585_50625 [Streptomyces sp. NBC_01340]
MERQEEQHQAAAHAEHAVVSRGSWCWNGVCAATLGQVPTGRVGQLAKDT